MTGPINRRRYRDTPPILQPWDHPALEEGLHEFNHGRHWHAHEAWEPLWMGLEEDDKVFVQGLIMAAAMLVQYGKGVHRGVRNHWHNVTLRLEPHRPVKWGIQVADLLHQLQPYAQDADAEGPLSRDPTAVRVHRTQS
jgi:hypothetical protein